MAWLGKVIGGTVGALFGGPMGAAFGATLGHLYYDGSSEAGRVRLELLERQVGVVGAAGPGLVLGFKLRGPAGPPGEQRLVVHFTAQGRRVRAGHVRYADAEQHLVVVAPLVVLQPEWGGSRVTYLGSLFLPYAALPEGCPSPLGLSVLATSTGGEELGRFTARCVLPEPEQRRTGHVLGALVCAAVALVRQSGPLEPVEVRCMQQVLGQCLKLDDMGLGALNGLVEQLQWQPPDKAQVLRLLRAYYPEKDFGGLVAFLEHVAAADGRVDEAERQWLNELYTELGWRRGGTEVGEGTGSALARLERHYRVLEVEVGAPWESIRAAYRRLATRYHPDQVAHQPEHVQAAHGERMRQLNEAYGALRALYGR